MMIIIKIIKANTQGLLYDKHCSTYLIQVHLTLFLFSH